MANPYLTALKWILQNPGTGSGVSLSKLLLSLWNSEDYPFSVAGCLGNLDGNLTRLALEMVEDYARRGETPELVEVGRKVYEVSPGLVELGIAARDAMSSVRQRWDNERQVERDRLYSDN